jgi:hypothetical protein
MSKVDKTMFQFECKGKSSTCITCLSVTNKRKGLRRRWSIKRTPQNVQSIQVQDEHNEAAKKCKTELKDITHQLLTNKVNMTMGDEGEWQMTPTDDQKDVKSVEVTEVGGGNLGTPRRISINE